MDIIIIRLLINLLLAPFDDGSKIFLSANNKVLQKISEKLVGSMVISSKFTNRMFFAPYYKRNHYSAK